MKKIFTLVAVIATAMVANAQSFVFTHQGKVLENGATVEVKAHEYLYEHTTKTGKTIQEWLVDCETDETFLLQNNTGSDIAYEGVLTVPERDNNWDLQWCLGSTCKPVNELPMTMNEVLPANETQSVNYHAAIEPQIGDYGSMLSTITINANGESRTVNIRFTYDESSNGIADVQNVNVKEVARYAANGSLLTAPQAGLNIVRMSDGSVRKVVVK